MTCAGVADVAVCLAAVGGDPDAEVLRVKNRLDPGYVVTSWNVTGVPFREINAQTPGAAPQKLRFGTAKARAPRVQVGADFQGTG